MTPEQFDILNGRLANIEIILLRAFAGNVPFENIVNQVRNLYDTANANKPDSEVPVSDNAAVQTPPTGDAAQADSTGGADTVGTTEVAAGAVGGTDNSNGAGS